MKINWLDAIKHVPWGDVAKNAPGVLDGAKKLWNRVAEQPPMPPAAEHPSMPATAGPSPEEAATAALNALHERIGRLEDESAELRGEMAASAKLINALAEQNAQLIKATDSLRKRASLLLGGLIAVAAGLIGCIIALLR